jgi:argininosuccinate lyase
MSGNQFDKKSQAWSALFSEPMSELVKRYTASVGFDQRLWRADIEGSLAHASMLAAQGIIGLSDLEDIQRGMAQVRTEIEAGTFDWRLELEDVHLNIEARLTQLVGDAGKRLHTGRSRNDQVATDVRLWLRGEIDAIAPLLVEMQRALVHVAAQHPDTVMPGFTHLQVAQPVSFAHHLLAYVEMFARDAERLADVRKRVNRLPLGAAALAGTSYPLDRERVARTLGFDEVCQNSLDAVSDRDFAIEFTAFAALVMVHVSRMAEEIVLWMSQNFGFVDLSDRYCTGSSIMPQKRNPDVAELARGKSGRVVGHLMGLITLMKGQPLTYNKDNQEDKEPLFDTVDTVKDTLRIMAEMIGGEVDAATGERRGGLTAKPEAMASAARRGYATATDLADYLVRKGLPFRDAHEVVAHAVKVAIDRGVDLAELPLDVLRGFDARIDEDVYAAMTLQGSLAARNVLGGTAPAQVREQIERHRARRAGGGGPRAEAGAAALPALAAGVARSISRS